MGLMRGATAVVLMAVLTSCSGGEAAAPTLPPGATPMPDVEGLRLDAAKVDLAEVGLDDSRVEVVGGGTFGVLNESAWWVCDQEPSAGHAVVNKASVLIDREGECGKSDHL